MNNAGKSYAGEGIREPCVIEKNDRARGSACCTQTRILMFGSMAPKGDGVALDSLAIQPVRVECVEDALP
jgi:hypothetical protein